MERKDGITAAMRAENFDMLDRLDAVAIVTGRAEFVGAHEVRLVAGPDELRIAGQDHRVATAQRAAVRLGRLDVPLADYFAGVGRRLVH